MNLNEAKKLLEKNNGNSSYSVFVPSLKKEVSFKLLLTGQQKTLAKMSYDDELNFNMLLIALINELSSEKLDLDILTELDLILILANIRKNNTVKNPLITTECDSCKFMNRFEFDILEYVNPLNKVIENKSYSFVDINKTKYEFTINFPTINKNIEFLQLVNAIKKKLIEEKREKEAEKNELQKITEVYKLLTYFREMKLNGNEIDNYYSLTIDDKIELFNEIPLAITNELKNKIQEDFVSIYQIIYSKKCRKCNEDIIISGGIELENFF